MERSAIGGHRRRRQVGPRPTGRRTGRPREHTAALASWWRGGARWRHTTRKDPSGYEVIGKILLGVAVDGFML